MTTEEKLIAYEKEVGLTEEEVYYVREAMIRSWSPKYDTEDIIPIHKRFVNTMLELRNDPMWSSTTLDKDKKESE